ncbi:uncharacterized protein UV8b_01133 [Ustilaginoidea virens]|uniref:Uncharacterized protein n=1 Tax=Ustilaginoidea virens TaxID=1159556 RepID=A0A8E5MEQ7_USTVR|nr:uncharacterized protein UV8b_01133 [Ustilaginoidea virens]QUC16892.1 hypothetical protein UV8b_01133 [Ustilaginoidea virens]
MLSFGHDHLQFTIYSDNYNSQCSKPPTSNLQRAKCLSVCQGVFLVSRPRSEAPDARARPLMSAINATPVQRRTGPPSGVSVSVSVSVIGTVVAIATHCHFIVIVIVIMLFG